MKDYCGISERLRVVQIIIIYKEKQLEKWKYDIFDNKSLTETLIYFMFVDVRLGQQKEMCLDDEKEHCRLFALHR